MKRSFALVCALASVAACGGDSSPSISKPSDFFLQAGLANCKLSARCGFIGASEEKACEAQVMADVKNYPTVYSYDMAVTSKKITFDAGAAQKCIDAIGMIGCVDNQLSQNPPACTTVFKGTVAVGGACLAQAECVDGSFCASTTFADGCSGVCTALVKTGGSCDQNQNLFCDSTSFCNMGTCAALLPDGADCTDDTTCQHGACIGTDVFGQTPGKCGPPAKEGENCDIRFTGDDCTPGLFCDFTLSTPVCVTRVGAGKECHDRQMCTDGLACIGLKVDPQTGMVTTAGSCGKLLDVGGACMPGADDVGCPFDSVCDMTKKACTVVGAEGSDCSMNGSNGTCGTDLYCDATTNLCTKQPALGQACTPPSDMDPQDHCHDGSCDTTSMKCALVCM